MKPRRSVSVVNGVGCGSCAGKCNGPRNIPPRPWVDHVDGTGGIADYWWAPGGIVGGWALGKVVPQVKGPPPIPKVSELEGKITGSVAKSVDDLSKGISGGIKSAMVIGALLIGGYFIFLNETRRRSI